VRVNAPHDPGASLSRITLRASLLLVPLVALAVAAPRILRMVRSATQSAPQLARLQADGGLAAPPGAEPAPPPRPPESPTPEQIEKAREAQVALGRAQKGWESVTVIMPRVAKAGDDGLETLPFQGFGVSVDSAPEGAKVLVGGEELGETPLVAGVKCEPGSDVVVRVEKKGLAARQRAIRCRADTLVKLSVRLDPAGAKR
jgi:hypothetical protein